MLDARFGSIGGYATVDSQKCLVLYGLQNSLAAYNTFANYEKLQEG
jgi:hypothetical protein